MQIVIKPTTDAKPFRIVADSHSRVMFFMSHKQVFTADAVISYLTEYKPDLVCSIPNGAEEYQDDHFLCLLLNVNRFRGFSPADRLRVIQKVFELYPNTDANYVNTHGSPCMLYALQLADIPIIEYLVSKGARFLKDGKAIRNNVYTQKVIDLQSCIQYNSAEAPALERLVKQFIYKEVNSS